jgi:predicted ferric reductase
MQNYELLPMGERVEGHRVQVREMLVEIGMGFLLALVGVLAGWWLAPLAVRVWSLVIPTGDKAAWYLTRATATVAYLLLTGSTIWGLMLSTKLVKAYVPAALAMALHSVLSWLAVALGGLHALLLLFDGYYTYTIADLLVPFVGPYRPFWVGLGVISLYGLAFTAASYWARQRLGYRTWRRLHYISFPLYLLVTLHGLLSGTDSAQAGAQLIYLVSASVVLLLSGYRVYSVVAAKPRVAS